MNQAAILPAPASPAAFAQLIKECLAAAQASADAQFKADGSKDCGSCGGYMLAYRGNSKFAKAMLEAGVGYKMDGKVYLQARHGLPSQHMALDEKFARAFRDVAAGHGIEPSVSYSYVD